MVHRMKIRSVNPFRKIYHSVRYNSYLNDIIFNLITVYPVNLFNTNYSYKSVLSFIYIISLLSSYLSILSKPSFNLFLLEFIPKLNITIHPLTYVVYPLFFSIPLFLLNCFFLFVIQLVGINLIKKSRNATLFGLFASIISFIPVMILLFRFVYFADLIIHAIAVLSVYFVQNTLEKTFGYTESRSSIIRYVVFYLAFEIFFYISLFISSICFNYCLFFQQMNFRIK